MRPKPDILVYKGLYFNVFFTITYLQNRLHRWKRDPFATAGILIRTENKL